MKARTCPPLHKMSLGPPRTPAAELARLMHAQVVGESVHGMYHDMQYTIDPAGGSWELTVGTHPSFTQTHPLSRCPAKDLHECLPDIYRNWRTVGAYHQPPAPDTGNKDFRDAVRARATLLGLSPSFRGHT